MSNNDPFAARRFDYGGHDLMRQVKRLTTDTFWSSDDTKKAILATLIPGAVAAGVNAAFSNDKGTMDWWMNSRKPEWAPRELLFYSAIDVGTMTPMGYASYLVYKYGGGFDYTDTRIALGLYGASLLLIVAFVPMMQKRSHKYIFRTTVLLNITAIAAAYTFSKIHDRAGMLMVPYAVWTTFYSLLAYSMSASNAS